MPTVATGLTYLDLAVALKDVATNIDDHLMDHWHDLTAAQRRTLNDWVYSLRDQAGNLLTYAARMIRTTTAPEARQLMQAVTATRTITRNLQDIKAGVALVAGLVAVAAAVVAAAQTGSLGALAAAGKDLYDVVSDYRAA